jgi:hypothetical protein
MLRPYAPGSGLAVATIALGLLGWACATAEQSSPGLGGASPATDSGTAGAGASAGGAAGVAGQGGAGQAGDGAAGAAGLDGSAASDGGTGSDGSPSDSSADGVDVSFVYDAPTTDVPVTKDTACATASSQAVKLPVDIVFVIDNSASMTQEIQAVEDNINDNFAGIIGKSGIDYRVIMLSRHGSAAAEQSICVRAPLSATSCNPIPQQPANNAPVFFHYSTEIASHDAWCKILTTFGAPDEFALAQSGWSQWLRQGAAKVFVVMTDDGVGCSAQGKTFNDADTIPGGQAAAQQFDAALLALSPPQFGTPQKRNYLWASIVCLAANTPPASPWLPSDPMVAGKCSSSSCPAPGTGHQALSILTGGLRFPLCESQAFDVVFQQISKGVVNALACKLAMPATDAGIIDPAKVTLEYTPSSGPKEVWKNAGGAATCSGAQWFYDDPANPKAILLCPEACAKAQADPGAKIEVMFGCLGS